MNSTTQIQSYRLTTPINTQFAWHAARRAVRHALAVCAQAGITVPPMEELELSPLTAEEAIDSMRGLWKAENLTAAHTVGRAARCAFNAEDAISMAFRAERHEAAARHRLTWVRAFDVASHLACCLEAAVEAAESTAATAEEARAAGLAEAVLIERDIRDCCPGLLLTAKEMARAPD